jgi:flagella basal body P-ring formation protein FlgA
MRTNRIAALLVSMGLWLAPGLVALAQNAALPTPRVVIYPGDIIHDDMLADRSAETANGPGPFVTARSQAIGKMARRTLLPGVAIPLAGIDNPRLVVNGAEVQIVYEDGGLTIVTVGSALQDGAIGDVIRVRNADSGVTVSGAVQRDGTVRVSGG